MKPGEFERLAQKHKGTVRLHYDQGRDPGLSASAATSEGACIVICARWLEARVTQLDFGQVCFQKSAGGTQLRPAAAASVRVDMNKYLGVGTQAERMREIRGLMPSVAPITTKKSTPWTPRAAHDPRDWRQDGEPLYLAEGQIGDGRELRAAVLATKAHVLIGVFDAGGEGHALAYWRGGGAAFFDPNYGEVEFTSEIDFAGFFMEFWANAYPTDFKKYRLTRFEPGQSSAMTSPWWLGLPPPDPAMGAAPRPPAAAGLPRPDLGPAPAPPTARRPLPTPPGRR